MWEGAGEFPFQEGFSEAVVEHLAYRLKVRLHVMGNRARFGLHLNKECDAPDPEPSGGGGSRRSGSTHAVLNYSNPGYGRVRERVTLLEASAGGIDRRNQILRQNWSWNASARPRMPLVRMLLPTLGLLLILILGISTKHEF
jgi:hypothetical protein